MASLPITSNPGSKTGLLLGWEITKEISEKEGNIKPPLPLISPQTHLLRLPKFGYDLTAHVDADVIKMWSTFGMSERRIFGENFPIGLFCQKNFFSVFPAEIGNDQNSV